MKNIHVLPTDKPCRLHFDSKLFLSPNYQDSKTINSIVEGRNIYITSNEEFKQGDWVIYRNTVFKIERDDDVLFDLINVDFRKIILTTDQDLMKDGVLAIGDGFLEWFINNPNCESVEVEKEGILYDYNYLIIIPKEAAKQETFEEVRVVKRTELYKSILSIVKQIPRKEVEGDAMDASSCAYELEQLFLKWQQKLSRSE